jgi:hypothetical protein
MPELEPPPELLVVEGLPPCPLLEPDREPEDDPDGDPEEGLELEEVPPDA